MSNPDIKPCWREYQYHHNIIPYANIHWDTYIGVNACRQRGTGQLHCLFGTTYWAHGNPRHCWRAQDPPNMCDKWDAEYEKNWNDQIATQERGVIEVEKASVFHNYKFLEKGKCAQVRGDHDALWLGWDPEQTDVQACYEKVMSDSRCAKDYFTYI